MITWFDALLVTLWGAVTMLGMRRGLAGGVWVLVTLLVAFVCNLLSWPIAAVVLATVLSFAAAWGVQRVFWATPTHTWHVAVGGVSGFVLGFVIVAALALSLPIKVLGSQGTYPSDELPSALYYGVVDSLLTQQFDTIWGSPSAVKRLIIPDQVR